MHIGLGPKAIKTGDIFCLLLGCSVPVISRPENDGNYVLISDAYEASQFAVNEMYENGVDFDYWASTWTPWISSTSYTVDE